MKLTNEVIQLKKKKEKKRQKRRKRKRKKEQEKKILFGLSLSPCPLPLQWKQYKKKAHIKDNWSKHRSKKNKRKTFQIKFSCFYLETTTTKIPLATINWQIRNWLCGSGAGIFRWHLLLCHYCGWSTSERGEWTAGRWLGLCPLSSSSQGQSFQVKHPFEMLSFPWNWKSLLASISSLQEMGQ